MKRLFAVLMLGCFLAVPSFAQTTKELFRIERNTNANIVRYDVVLNEDGTINAKNPIDSYWLLLAGNGQREEITSLQRRAYGFTITQNEAGGYFSMFLTAVADKEIKVYIKDGVPRAEILINNRPAYLSSVFVNAVNRLFIPRVTFYIINGTDIETGEQVSERVDVR